MISRLTLAGSVRAALVLVAALVGVTYGSRLPLALPDLVLPLVVAAGLLGGATRGALVGLGAGWVVDLMPPGGVVLGASAVLYAAGGVVAGSGRREGETPLGWVAVVVAASAATVFAGRAVVALLSAGQLSWPGLGARWVLTVGVCLLAVPLLVGLEQALLRRRVG